MSLKISLLLVIIVFIFCDTQCYKEPLCRDRDAIKKLTNSIQNPQKSYHIGDSIRISCSFPYTALNDLVDNSTPPQRYRAYSLYSLIELPGNILPYHGQFAASKFDWFASSGILIPPGAGYVYESTTISLANDSLNGKYECSFIIVPKQQGSFILFQSGGQMDHLTGECNRTYSIRYTAFWNLPSRNLEIATELGLPQSLLFKNFSGSSGFYMDRVDERLFYFYVQ